jgi:hypothetical protein
MIRGWLFDWRGRKTSVRIEVGGGSRDGGPHRGRQWGTAADGYFRDFFDQDILFQGRVTCGAVRVWTADVSASAVFVSSMMFDAANTSFTLLPQ